MKVGVVGVGEMGAAMAGHLVAKGGHQVTAFDINRERLAAAGRNGIAAASSLEDLAKKALAKKPEASFEMPASRITSSTRFSLTTASQATAVVGAQTYQVRVSSTLPLWATIGSTAVITANSSAAFIPANKPEYFNVTAGQVLNFLTTSTSTGYVVVTEMT